MKEEKTLTMLEVNMERRISTLEGKITVILSITGLNFLGTVALVLALI